MDTISNGPPPQSSQNYPAPVYPAPTSPAYSSQPATAIPKKKPHGCLGAFLGFCLAIAFMILLGLISVRLTLLNPNFWKTWLDKSGAYEQVGSVLVPALFSSFSVSAPAGSPPAPTAPNEALPGQGGTPNISPEAWEKLGQSLQRAVTPVWLRQQAVGAIDNFFGWARGATPGLRIVFDLRPLRQPLAEGIKEMMREQFSQLPLCPAGRPAPELDAELSCLPSGKSFDQLWTEMQAQSPEDFIMANLPEEYVIDETQWQMMFQPMMQTPGLGQAIVKNFADPSRGYRAFMMLLWINVAVVAGLVGLIILLYRRAVPTMLKTIAIPILVVAAIDFVSSLVTASFATASALPLTAFGPMSAGSPVPGGADQQFSQIMELTRPLQVSFGRELAWPSLWLSGISLAGAIVMLIIASWLRKKSAMPR